MEFLSLTNVALCGFGYWYCLFRLWQYLPQVQVFFEIGMAIFWIDPGRYAIYIHPIQLVGGGGILVLGVFPLSDRCSTLPKDDFSGNIDSSMIVGSVFLFPGEKYGGSQRLIRFWRTLVSLLSAGYFWVGCAKNIGSDANPPCPRFGKNSSEKFGEAKTDIYLEGICSGRKASFVGAFSDVSIPRGSMGPHRQSEWFVHEMLNKITESYIKIRFY